MNHLHIHQLLPGFPGLRFMCIVDTITLFFFSCGCHRLNSLEDPSGDALAVLCLQPLFHRISFKFKYVLSDKLTTHAGTKESN